MNRQLARRDLARLTALVGLLAGAVPAQDDRSNDSPVASVWYTSRTTAQITSIINQGFRPVDLEVVSASPLLLDVAFVRNTGSFAKSFWWYSSISPTSLANFIGANNARIIDLEPFDVSGVLRFAAILIPNTGVDAKAWWWYYNTSTSTISSALSANNARIVDYERYTIGSRVHRSAVMIRNTGADARSWLWRTDVTSATVSSLLGSNNMRIYDIEAGALGRHDVVMIDNAGSHAIPWWYYYGLTATDVNFLLAQNGARLMDLQRAGSYFNVVMLNNANPLSRRVADVMAARSDGERGVYLKAINGPVHAWILADLPHEPASTLKTLHHVHAMYRVLVDPFVSLTSLLSVYTGNPPNSCPSLNTGHAREPMQSVLSAMMMASDNTRTRAVTDFFGMSNLNATAASLGMSDTTVNHHIGCGTPANVTTLVDIGRLHERVANGYLGSQRQTFYDLMRSDFYSSGYAEGALGPVIDQEAAAVGLTANQKNGFVAAIDIAHKKGGYGVPTGYHRAWGAWIRLPFQGNGGITGREYVVGSFVARATNETRAVDAASAGAAEVLRDEIRAAMLTWRNHVPGSVTSIGSGCAGTVGIPSQTYQGVPELGQTLTYRLANAPAGGVTALNIGLSNTQWNGLRLPLDLGVIGAPVCRILTGPVASYARTLDRQGTTSLGLGIGTSTALIGAQWFTQWVVVDPGANAASLIVSNGFRTQLGGQP